ncbi:MAG: nucleoside deaminase [Actinomycetota bacterium]|nr:nucleoside deaminase [Actinomycetota bacterium]
MAISDSDLERLRRCVDLARQALDAGDEPFGSVLVGSAGRVRFADHDRVSGGAARHAWVGLGRIVYATSSAQLSRWLAEWGAPAPPVATLPLNTVAPGVPVDGPAPELADAMQALYREKFGS